MRSILSLALVLSIVSAVNVRHAAADGAPGYRTRLEVRGRLPWMADSSPEAHTLVVSETAMRLVSEKSGDGIIIRLDEKAIYTLSRSGGRYAKDGLESLALDAERQKDRKKKWKRIMEKSDSDEEADRWLEQAGLRRDGKTVIEVIQTAQTRQIAGHTCPFYTVWENNKPVVRLWTAPGLERPAGVTRFFQETGVFSDEMAAKLVGIPGFPLAIEVEMEYSLAEVDLSMTITSIEKTDLPDAEFDVPEGLEAEPEAPPPQEFRCPVCGKAVKETTPHFRPVPRLNKRYRYDTAECKEKDLDRVMKEVLEK